MKVVIIEDEPLTAKDLAACILAAEPGAEIVAMLDSVEEAIRFFKGHAAPDIIFSDIQLGDGLSFSIFAANVQTVPVIFCTAYDEYALDAFRAAGIDYILKPFTTKTIVAALAKYKAFRGRWADTAPGNSGGTAASPGIGEPAASPGIGAPSPPLPSYAELAGLFGQEAARRSILVYYKEKIMPVAIADIALFHLRDELVRLVTFSKQQYVVNKNLEELERLTGRQFYRVNRQGLVNREAIKDVSQDGTRSLVLNLLVPFEEKLTVGRVKAGDFLSWLAGEHGR
jgi:two-component system, LytTR family, response regulator LytT